LFTRALFLVNGQGVSSEAVGVGGGGGGGGGAATVTRAEPLAVQLPSELLAVTRTSIVLPCVAPVVSSRALVPLPVIVPAEAVQL
jgi:hypothetical protein